MNKIIGIVPVGTVVRIDHAGDPLDGRLVTVGTGNGMVGGVAGGGAVRVTYADGTTGLVSRWTRVTPA